MGHLVVVVVHAVARLLQGFRGSGFRVHGSGFGVQGSGFRVQGSGFRVQGSGFRVRVHGFGLNTTPATPQLSKRVERSLPDRVVRRARDAHDREPLNSYHCRANMAHIRQARPTFEQIWLK